MNPVVIDEKIVRRLYEAQFPQWKDLLIHLVAHSGWDNRTFHHDLASGLTLETRKWELSFGDRAYPSLGLRENLSILLPIKLGPKLSDRLMRHHAFGTHAFVKVG